MNEPTESKRRRPWRVHAVLLAAALAIGLAIGWAWRARLASDPEALPAGCFLTYEIGSERLRLQSPSGRARTFDDVKSGNGSVQSIAHRNIGPLPPGAYRVLTRDDGRPTYDGHPAFILDPLDGLPGNDRLDGWPAEQGGGRSAFRIHAGSASQGCLATEAIDEIAAILLPHASEQRFDVYSHPADSGRPGIKRYRQVAPGDWEPAPDDGDWELFEAERLVGLLWVVP